MLARRLAILLALLPGVLLARHIRAADPPPPAATVACRPGTEEDTVWSPRRIENVPAGNRTLLGPFGPERVTAKLDRLPDHRWVEVTFRLAVLRSWDGETADVWKMGLADGPTLIATTFSNCGFLEFGDKQCWPDFYPAAIHDARAGAAQNNSLGYTYTFLASGNGTQQVDSVYAMRAVFPHRGPTLQLAFWAEGLTPSIDDEGWGLFDVEVKLFGTPPSGKLPVGTIRRLVQTAAADEATQAQQALQKLIGAGEPARKALEAYLAKQLPLSRRVELLLADLSDPRHVVRARARRHLTALGARATPCLELAGLQGDAQVSAMVETIFAERGVKLETRVKQRGLVRLLLARHVLCWGLKESAAASEASLSEGG
jgi:hypothetical protein